MNDFEIQKLFGGLETQLRRIAFALECDVTEKHGLKNTFTCAACGCTLLTEDEPRCPVCGQPMKGHDDEGDRAQAG